MPLKPWTLGYMGGSIWTFGRVYNHPGISRPLKPYPSYNWETLQPWFGLVFGPLGPPRIGALQHLFSWAIWAWVFAPGILNPLSGIKKAFGEFHPLPHKRARGVAPRV